MAAMDDNRQHNTQLTLNQLKAAFTTAPILKHPDLLKPFSVEVDASETGVRDVLSQRF